MFENLIETLKLHLEY